MHASANPGIFLTAEWRDLAMLNYLVPRKLLLPFVPRGTELDTFRDQYLISLVGFRFLQTKVRGVAWPFHRNFEEVNLRFYVRRNVDGLWRRGVVFIREIVPRRAIAGIARLLYGEKYVALPMSHQIDRSPSGVQVCYAWTHRGRRNEIHISAAGQPEVPAENTQARFITEHFCGYSAQPDGGCVEYWVEHPSWAVWMAYSAQFQGEVEGLYGSEFAEIVRGQPASAFLAVGSPVIVYRGRRM